MVFHIWFILRRWTDPIFDRNEPMLLIENTRWDILLMSIQFESSRAPLPCVFEQGCTDSIMLVKGTDI